MVIHLKSHSGLGVPITVPSDIFEIFVCWDISVLVRYLLVLLESDFALGPDYYI